jgi:hypothetical protein
VLQTENNELRQENASLRQEVQAGKNKEDSMEDSPPLVQALAPTSPKRSRYAYISQKIILQFQPSVDPSDIPYEQIAWWKDIFSYIQPNDYERLHLRRLCNMFKASLKAPPKGMFTVYPHVNHTSIDSLLNRLNALHSLVPHLAATIVFIQEGEHQVEGYQREPYEDEDEDDEEELHKPYLIIKYAMKIIGAGRDKTILLGGGFEFKGTKEEGKEVNMQDMTTKGSSGSGLYNNNGLSFLCSRMTFTQCGAGVVAQNTKGRLINCAITQCKYGGIGCNGNALIELEGSQTKVDGNGTGRASSYGLFTYNRSSKIHLLFPLTKESVSTNNHDGQNYGRYNGGSPDHSPGSTIQTVDSFETP